MTVSSILLLSCFLITPSIRLFRTDTIKTKRRSHKYFLKYMKKVKLTELNFNTTIKIDFKFLKEINLVIYSIYFLK